MEKVSIETKIKVPADQVWRLIGNFHTLQDWHPAVEKSEQQGDGVGALRTLHLVGGGKIIERLEESNDNERLYSYSIVEGPLPVSSYVATLRVREDDDGSATLLQWSSNFVATGDSQDAIKTIEGIYREGFDNIRRLFGM